MGTKHTPTIGQLALRDFISDLKAAKPVHIPQTGQEVSRFEYLADKLGVSSGHIQNIASGTRKCTAALAIALERESKGKVACEEICPDADWEYIRSSKTPKG